MSYIPAYAVVSFAINTVPYNVGEGITFRPTQLVGKEPIESLTSATALMIKKRLYGYMETSLAYDGTFLVQSIAALTGATIVAVLDDGRTMTVSGANIVDEVSVKLENGLVPVKFIGTVTIETPAL
jgi:hypothetical protein